MASMPIPLVPLDLFCGEKWAAFLPLGKLTSNPQIPVRDHLGHQAAQHYWAHKQQLNEHSFSLVHWETLDKAMASFPQCFRCGIRNLHLGIWLSPQPWFDGNAGPLTFAHSVRAPRKPPNTSYAVPQYTAPRHGLSRLKKYTNGSQIWPPQSNYVSYWLWTIAYNHLASTSLIPSVAKQCKTKTRLVSLVLWWAAWPAPDKACRQIITPPPGVRDQHNCGWFVSATKSYNSHMRFGWHGTTNWH